MTALCRLETAKTSYPVTRIHIPDLNSCPKEELVHETWASKKHSTSFQLLVHSNLNNVSYQFNLHQIMWNVILKDSGLLMNESLLKFKLRSEIKSTTPQVLFAFFFSLRYSTHKFFQVTSTELEWGQRRRCAPDNPRGLCQQLAPKQWLLVADSLGYALGDAHFSTARFIYGTPRALPTA
jgi:hypothetical protein